MSKPTLLHYLVYTYLTPNLMCDEELFDHLQMEAKDRLLYNLSGRSIYMETSFISRSEGRIIEYVEGEGSAIDQHYEKLKKDFRCSGLLVLEFQQTTEAQFTDWNMSFIQKNLPAASASH